MFYQQLLCDKILYGKRTPVQFEVTLRQHGRIIVRLPRCIDCNYKHYVRRSTKVQVVADCLC